MKLLDQRAGITRSLVVLVGIEKDMHLIRFVLSAFELRHPLAQFISRVDPIKTIAAVAGEVVPVGGIAAMKAHNGEVWVRHAVDRWHAAAADLWLIRHRVGKSRFP